jgi:predicted PurR-regulated permease PerM
MHGKWRLVCTLLFAALALALVGWGLWLFEPRLVPLVVGTLLWFDASRSGEGRA